MNTAIAGCSSTDALYRNREAGVAVDGMDAPMSGART